jgi:hypothetical protein
MKGPVRQRRVFFLAFVKCRVAMQSIFLDARMTHGLTIYWPYSKAGPGSCSFFEWDETGTEMAKEDTGSTDRILRLFQRFDTNGDGFIDEDEFGEILKSLGWDSAEEIRSLEFAMVDTDSDGQVDFREFADWWRDQN